MDKSTSKKRARKAYRLAYRIMWNYLWLFARKKVFGQQYFDKRIGAVHQKNAERIKGAILELRGLFVKVGQLLSVMSTILPDAYAEVLESLQDAAPASPFSETEATIQKELGESISALFAEFDEVPIASASIGQVYKARLKTGEQVAVKIQHSNIEALAELDLNIVENLVKKVSFFLKINGIEFVYQQVRKMVEEELDYALEAKSMVRISENIAEFENIVVPKVYPSYSSPKIIVCAFHEGVKITNREKLAEWNIDPQVLSETLITAFCKMILVDGFYHADPHPGNVLVNQKGEIILLDFGATAVLNDEMRKEIPIIIQHIIRKDTPKIIASLQKMGFLGTDYDSMAVAEKLVDALTTFVQNEIKIDNMNFKDVSFDDIKGSSIDRLRKEIGVKNLTNTIRVPKDWILLDRAMILIQGISATIAPEYNPMDTVKPYLKKMVLSGGGLKNIISDTIKQEFTALIQLPSALNQFLDNANRGKLVVETRNKDLRKMYALGHQFMLFMALIALIFLTVFSQHPTIEFWSIPVGAILIVMLIVSVRRNRR
ncbi:ABC1 kinase family protein [Crocinitomix catalasitica]|uniref:ABC1 kinase family protein n=1 Tax=Crocinitomix catalasitica TaxID=184607 RepID=UPI000480871C|nr:AarF/UbiB family protein [Crocinitomix catalasitica]